jgi:protein-tyrosine kinase
VLCAEGFVTPKKERMSRIHDLLNRAEHKRDVLRVVEAELEHSRETPESLASRPTALPASLPSVASSDGLLAGCTHHDWKPDPGTMLFLNAKEQSLGTEEFRALRSRLYQLRETRPLKTLLVTSSLPAEGKSFVAANLSQVLALQPDCRVLLIDADLRRPRLHLALGAPDAPGLSEYLLDDTEMFGVIQRGSVERLFFIPSGRSTPGPTELVGNGRLKALIGTLVSSFDWIIIDSPPALPFSDACLIANCCDGVLMVVRSSSTPLEVVRKGRRKFREGHLAGVVLNGTDHVDSPEIH